MMANLACKTVHSFVESIRSFERAFPSMVSSGLSEWSVMVKMLKNGREWQLTIGGHWSLWIGLKSEPLDRP